MKSNEHSLREKLSKLSIPASKDETQKQALQLALEALHGPKTSVEPAPRASWVRPVSLAMAACLIFVTFCLWQLWHPKREPSSGKLLTEVELLFPGQVSAVIMDGGEMHVELAETPTDAPTDQRIRVTLSNGTQLLNVLTYSGRKVCVELDHRHVCFTALLNGEGSIFLVTDTSVIVPTDDATMGGFRLSVEHLHAS